jgi:hypothetical protein
MNAYRAYVSPCGTHWRIEEGEQVNVDGVKFVRVGKMPNATLVPVDQRGGRPWFWHRAGALGDAALAMEEVGKRIYDKAFMLRAEAGLVK